MINLLGRLVAFGRERLAADAVRLVLADPQGQLREVGTSTEGVRVTS